MNTRKMNNVKKKGGKGGAVHRHFGFCFLIPSFSFQYNRRAWSADEMAIPSILRDMGPNDIEAE
jgi:hypothetical protein